MSKTLAALAGATALATVGAEAIFEDLWTQSETCGAGTLATIARQYQVPVGTCMSWGANNELGFKTKAVCAGSPLGLTYEKYNALSDPSCKGAPYATTVVPANTCGSSAAPVPGLYPDGVPSNDYASAQISAATCEPITDDIFTISLYETSDGSCGGQKIGGGFPGIGAVLTANAGCIKFLSNSSQVGKFFGPDGITAMQLTVPRGNEVTLSVYKNSVCSQDSLLHAASGDAEDYRPQPTCKTMTVRTGDPAGGPVFSRTYDAVSARPGRAVCAPRSTAHASPHRDETVRPSARPSFRRPPFFDLAAHSQVHWRLRLQPRGVRQRADARRNYRHRHGRALARWHPTAAPCRSRRLLHRA